MNDIDINNISYWFGPLRDSGVRVPETVIVRTEINMNQIIGERRPSGYADFLEEFGQSIASLPGPPYFIRTGHTAYSSIWNQTCYLENIDDLDKHIYQLSSGSHSACLPASTWAAREYLRTRPRFHEGYGKPFNREYRVYFRDKEVSCRHPLHHPHDVWKPDRDDWRYHLGCLHETPISQLRHLEKMTRRVAAMPEFSDREWAVEWLKAADGDWIAIDMKLSSFVSHWPDCPRYAGSMTYE